MNFMDIYFIDLLARLPILSIVVSMVGALMIFLFAHVCDFDGRYKFILYSGIVLSVIGVAGIFLSPSQELIELLRGAQQ